MKKEPAGILQIVRRRAVVWLHEVMDPFRVLLGFLPRLRDAIDASARTLSSAPGDVPAAIARLRDDLKVEQRRAKEALDRLTVLQAAALEGSIDAAGVLVAHLPDADAAQLRVAALQLIATPGRVVALLGGSAPHALVVARSTRIVTLHTAARIRASANVITGGESITT